MCPRVFRAPEGPAAREARQPRFARRRASKPALALRSLRRPSHQWGRVAEVWLGALSRAPASPRRRPPAPRQIPSVPSTPVGPGVLRSSLARYLVIRPGPATAHRHRNQALDPWRGCLCCSHSGAFGYALLQTSSIRGVFRVDFCVVVTNVVNPMAFSLKMVIFGLGLTTFVTGVLVRRFESCWFDDVCNVGRPLVARPGPAAAHGYRRLALSASWAGCLKPSSPLRAPAEPRLKPPSPLRVRKGCFWCIFRAQR